jgi:hypothetical protein
MTSGLDVALGARCALELLGGDPVRGTASPALEPALARYFERCATSGARAGVDDAPRALADFDRLIDTLWGPRQFRVLTLPPKR